MAITLNRWAPFEWAGLFWLPAASSGIRAEEFAEDDSYVIRTELPGIDPNKDVTLSVGDGVLILRAQRANPRKNKTSTEFHYGQFERSFVLPVGAREDSITAEYDKGVLTVAVKVADPMVSRPIKITIGHPASIPTPAKVTHKK